MLHGRGDLHFIAVRMAVCELFGRVADVDLAEDLPLLLAGDTEQCFSMGVAASYLSHLLCRRGGVGVLVIMFGHLLCRGGVGLVVIVFVFHRRGHERDIEAISRAMPVFELEMPRTGQSESNLQLFIMSVAIAVFFRRARFIDVCRDLPFLTPCYTELHIAVEMAVRDCCRAFRRSCRGGRLGSGKGSECCEHSEASVHLDGVT